MSMLENKLLNFLRVRPDDSEIIDLCGWLFDNGVQTLIFQDKNGDETRSKNWPADMKKWIDQNEGTLRRK